MIDADDVCLIIIIIIVAVLLYEEIASGITIL